MSAQATPTIRGALVAAALILIAPAALSAQGAIPCTARRWTR